MAFLLSTLVAFTHAGSDRIVSLPNYNGPALCFKQFSGYLPVDGGAKNLFHWYVERTTKPETAPLVFWLNGGPGCSSLGGFFQEHGPFVLRSEPESLDITLNPYSWNVAANVLYIEQPAGIGFSYPAGPANDTQTAGDTTQAIAAFLALHPELEGRPLYIAGES